MTIFNFYIDEKNQEAVKEKLGTLLPGHKKGLTASLIRVLLRQFVAQKDVPQELLDAVEADYLYQAGKNKRGTTKM